MVHIDDNAVLVIGASRGIGRAIAEAYGREGASIAVASRSIRELRSIAETMDSDAVAIECDVRKTDEVNDTVEQAVDEFGRLDTVVFCAGVYLSGPLTTTDDDDLDRVIDVNLKGALRTARASLSELKATEGTLLFISSVVSQIGMSGIGVYGSTKGGIDALTRELAVEYAPENITVNTVSPGTIKTPMNKELRKRNPSWADERAADIPLGRVGDPEDVAGLVLFLSSERASYITGQVMLVDGGRSIR